MPFCIFLISELSHGIAKGQLFAYFRILTDVVSKSDIVHHFINKQGDTFDFLIVSFSGFNGERVASENKALTACIISLIHL